MTELIRIDRTVVRRNIFVTLAFDLIVLACLASFIAFYRVGELSFHRVDETTHVRVTQEMSETGDLWHPSVFGKNYYNKPPFKMWLSLIPVKLFGQTNFGYRFIDGASGVLSILALYLFARSVFRSRTIAVIAALTLITSRAYIFHHGIRTATQDSMTNFLNLLAVMIGWRLTTLLRRESSSHGAARRKAIVYSVIGGVLIGLSVMTKNVAGYIPLFIIAVFVVLAGETKILWKRGKLPIALVAGLGILIPALYVVPHCMESRGMCMVMLGDEVYDRALVGYHNQRDRFFYVERLWRGAGAPAALLIPGILLSLGYWFFRHERRYLLVLVWALAPVTVFSFIPSRLTWYMVPAFPGCALLSGIAFEVLLKQFFRRALLWWRGVSYSFAPALGFGAYLLFATVGLGINASLVLDRVVNWKYRVDIDLLTHEIYRNPELRKLKLISFREPELARNERVYRDRLPLRERIDDLEILKSKLAEPSTGFLLTDVSQFGAVAALRPFFGYRIIAPEPNRKSWLVFLSYVPFVRTVEGVRQAVDFGHQDEDAMLYGWGKPVSAGALKVRAMIEPEAAFLLSTDEAHEVLPVRMTFHAAMVKTDVVPGLDLQVLINSAPVGTIHIGGGQFRSHELELPPGIFHSDRSVVTFKVLSADALAAKQYIQVNWALFDIQSGPGISVRESDLPRPLESEAATEGVPTGDEETEE